MQQWIAVLTNEIIVTNMVYSVGLIVGILILNFLTTRIICKRQACQNRKFTMKRIIKSSYIVIALVVMLVIWNDESEYIIAFIGLFSAGMAIAMKDIWLNLLGGMYITWTMPFKIGDRVEIMGQTGDVIDIKALGFNMLEVGNRIAGEQSTGRIVHIPNMHIFNYPLANYEKGFKYVWNELAIPIQNTSDWKLAKEIMYEILQEYSTEIIEEAKNQIEETGKRYSIAYTNLTPIIYTELQGQYVVLTMRYLCEPRKSRMSENFIWETVLDKFKEHEEIRL